LEPSVLHRNVADRLAEELGALGDNVGGVVNPERCDAPRLRRLSLSSPRSSVLRETLTSEPPILAADVPRFAAGVNEAVWPAELTRDSLWKTWVQFLTIDRV